MTCQEVMEYMQRQLDDDLNDHEADALTAHTRYCSDCADMFERLKRLSAELDNLPKVVPAFSLVDAIIPQLDLFDSERQESGIAIESKLFERGAEPAGGQETEIVPISRRSARGREKGWLKRISWPAVTGVAAAGLVAGLFLVMFNPTSAPDLKSDSASMESATASLEQKDMSAADGAKSKQSADEVRIESTTEENSTASKVQSKSVATGQQPTEAPSSSDVNKKIDVVTPYADVPGYHIEDQSGTSAPLAPSDEATRNYNSNSAITGAGSAGSDSADAAADRKEVTMIAKDQYGEPMGITSTGSSSSADISNVVPSPDGSLSAAIVDGAVLVYTSQEGTVQLDSGKKTGTISGLQWSDDGKALFFEVKADGGQTTHYKIDTQEWTIASQ
ncbi:anti-sigma factor family protein [Paenibacillus kobensis]|uniref:anti-sigma factor family protein n=1 Tax=Paenibacillus kobensis TaxID=59841 RepID=UPI000FDA3569|nr:zf-HC2 domain-containing protein [Paenibacillus kobensis]